MDVAEVTTHGPAPGIDRPLLGEGAKSAAVREPVDDLDCRRLVGEQDVTDAARFAPPVSIAVADVVRAHGARIDRHGRGDPVHEARHDRRRQGSLVPGRRDAGRLGLVEEDRFGHQLLDDPATRSGRCFAAVRREMAPARASTDIGQARLEPRQRDRSPTDHRDDGGVGARGQPLTPPTVMPSTKNRWAKMKHRMIGRTTSVEAAISRL